MQISTIYIHILQELDFFLFLFSPSPCSLCVLYLLDLILVLNRSSVGMKNPKCHLLQEKRTFHTCLFLNGGIYQIYAYLPGPTTWRPQTKKILENDVSHCQKQPQRPTSKNHQHQLLPTLVRISEIKRNRPIVNINLAAMNLRLSVLWFS